VTPPVAFTRARMLSRKVFLQSPPPPVVVALPAGRPKKASSAVLFMPPRSPLFKVPSKLVLFRLGLSLSRLPIKLVIALLLKPLLPPDEPAPGYALRMLPIRLLSDAPPADVLLMLLAPPPPISDPKRAVRGPPKLPMEFAKLLPSGAAMGRGLPLTVADSTSTDTKED